MTIWLYLKWLGDILVWKEKNNAQRTWFLSAFLLPIRPYCAQRFSCNHQQNSAWASNVQQIKGSILTFSQSIYESFEIWLFIFQQIWKQNLFKMWIQRFLKCFYLKNQKNLGEILVDWAKNQSINKARSTSKYCCVEFLPQTTIRKRSSNPRAGGPQRDLWKNHLTKKIWVWNSISSRPLFSQICWPFDNRRPLEQEKRKIVNKNSGRKIKCVASCLSFCGAVTFSSKNFIGPEIGFQTK